MIGIKLTLIDQEYFSQTAKAYDFETLNSLSLHYYPMRDASRDLKISNNRDPESGMNCDPDSY